MYIIVAYNVDNEAKEIVAIMTRTDFKDAYRMARTQNESLRIFHNGRWFALARGRCDRLLGSTWLYDRPRGAEVAMTLDGVAFMRRQFKLACRESLALARNYRTAA